MKGVVKGKTHDAIVPVRLGDRNVTFALEYERTAKSEERYADILNKFDLEKNLDRFPYLASSEEVLRFVSWQFRNSGRHICFGLLGNWYHRLLDTEVFDWECHQFRPLRTALGSNTHPPIFPNGARVSGKQPMTRTPLPVATTFGCQLLIVDYPA